jgi:hypothetical protein
MSARLLVVWAIVCGLGASSWSNAFAAGSGFYPKIGDVCTPSPNNPKLLILNYQLVVSQLVEKTLQLSPIDLNATPGAGLKQGEEANAILDPETFCSTNSSIPNGGHCGKNVAIKLGTGIVYFQNFLHLNAHPTDPNKDSIDTTKLVSSDQQRQYTLITQFLRGNSEAAVAVCSPAPPTGQGSGQGQQPSGNGSTSGGGGGGSAAGQNQAPGYFSLRQSVQDLPIPQSSQNFKGAKQATISYTDDQVALKQSFSVQATAGYTFGPTSLDPVGHYVAQITPYLLYNQQTVETATAKNNSSVQNLGGGLLGDLFMPTGIGDTYQDIKIYPQYVESLRNGARVFSGNYIYTPEYGIPGIDSAIYIIGNVLSAKLTPELKFAVNDVINAGTGTTALTAGSFYMVGPYADLKLFGEGVLSGLTYDISYETYDVISALLKQVSYLQTNLSYNFGATNLMSITLGYQYGRDLNTFEKINLITLGLGLKY